MSGLWFQKGSRERREERELRCCITNHMETSKSRTRNQGTRIKSERKKKSYPIHKVQRRIEPLHPLLRTERLAPRYPLHQLLPLVRRRRRRRPHRLSATPSTTIRTLRLAPRIRLVRWTSRLCLRPMQGRILICMTGQARCRAGVDRTL